MPLHVWYDSRLEGQSFLLNASAFGRRKNSRVFLAAIFFLSKPWLDFSVHPPKLLLNLHSLTNDQSRSVWSPQYPQLLMRCISNQKITPEKSEMMKAFSVRTVGRDGGGEGREGCCCCCLPLLLLFSLRGLRWVSRLRLFPLSFPFFVSDSLLLALLLVLLLSQPFFFFFFPHPLFIPPHPALGLSQGLNLWLWSYRSIGMATHALLCFVSMLACRLVSLTWLCVHALHSCHDVCAPRPSKYGPLSFLFSGLVMCFSPNDRSKRRHVSCMGCFTLSSKMHLKIRVACVCECSEPENTGDLML